MVWIYARYPFGFFSFGNDSLGGNEGWVYTYGYGRAAISALCVSRSLRGCILCAIQLFVFSQIRCRKSSPHTSHQIPSTSSCAPQRRRQLSIIDTIFDSLYKGPTIVSSHRLCKLEPLVLLLRLFLTVANMGSHPDSNLHPVATGPAKAIVDAHQDEQPLKLYSGWL